LEIVKRGVLLLGFVAAGACSDGPAVGGSVDGNSFHLSHAGFATASESFPGSPQGMPQKSTLLMIADFDACRTTPSPSTATILNISLWSDESLPDATVSLPGEYVGTLAAQNSGMHYAAMGYTHWYSTTQVDSQGDTALDVMITTVTATRMAGTMTARVGEFDMLSGSFDASVCAPITVQQPM
jgi:hypothetical protein